MMVAMCFLCILYVQAYIDADQQIIAKSNQKVQFLLDLLSNVHARSACMKSPAISK